MTLALFFFFLSGCDFFGSNKQIKEQVADLVIAPFQKTSLSKTDNFDAYEAAINGEYTCFVSQLAPEGSPFKYQYHQIKLLFAPRLLAEISDLKMVQGLRYSLDEERSGDTKRYARCLFPKSVVAQIDPNDRNGHEPFAFSGLPDGGFPARFSSAGKLEGVAGAWITIDPMNWDANKATYAGGRRVTLEWVLVHELDHVLLGSNVPHIEFKFLNGKKMIHYICLTHMSVQLMHVRLTPKCHSNAQDKYFFVPLSLLNTYKVICTM